MACLGKAKESNWLPAPNDTIYLLLRLYWPKDTPPSILRRFRDLAAAIGRRGLLMMCHDALREKWA
jgi:hypothetical protein